MPDEVLDVSAESSTASATPQDTSAGTQNTEQGVQGQANPQQQAQQPQNVPFDRHPRWQQLMRERAQDRQQIANLTRSLQQIQARGQQPSTGQTLTDDERQAIGALRSLIQKDPELAALLQLPKMMPHLAQGYGNVQQLAQAQQRATQAQARSHITSLADKAGLDTKNQRAMEHLVRSVAYEATKIDGAEERLASGDTSVLDEAFQTYREHVIGPAQRQAAQTVLDTKTKTAALPRPARGGAAGNDPVAPPKAGEERQWEANMHKRARDLLRNLGAGG